jgi:Sulfotransferase domain
MVLLWAHCGAAARGLHLARPGKERGTSEITLKRSPLYASLPTIYDHHDQLWAGTPTHFLDHLYNDFDYRVDDVWLSSYPRSGTAWTYEVLYAVLYESDIAAFQHAQSEGKILKFLPIEIGSAAGVSERITTWKALPSRAIASTNLCAVDVL